MAEDKKDLQSLLREASNISGINGQHIEISKREQDIERAIEIVEEGDRWKDIEEAMNGRLAKRFLDEIDALPGREFIRVYGKMIEYFKPKIVRVENKPVEEEDMVLRIEIHNSKQIEENNIIDITPEEE